MRILSTLLVIVLAATAVAEDRVTLVDLDSGEPADGWTASGIGLSETTVEDGRTPGAGRALTLVADGEPKNGRFGFARTDVAVNDWRTFRALSFHANVEADADVEMRVMAYRAPGPAALLKRFTLQPGHWREVVLPLSEFRDDTVDQVCDFSRIDVLLIRWDATPGRVTVDDIALLPGDRGEESALPTIDEHLELAFPKGKGRSYTSDHFLLLTNARKLNRKGAEKLLARCEEGLSVLRDVYGIDGEPNALSPLLVFEKREQYVAYHERLGQLYRLGIAPPRGDGYSVLGRATSSWSKKHGWDRPTFVHEAMHAATRRLLGVNSSSNWLQEGLANGVQLRLYPESASTVDIPAWFEKRAAGGRGSLVPFAELFAESGAPSKHYIQYLTIMDFLADRHRDALPAVWTGVRAMRGRVHEKALATITGALGQDAETFEREWVEWGAAYYRGRTELQRDD